VSSVGSFFAYVNDARSHEPEVHMIYISSNNFKHPVTKTFTTLHYTCRHFTSSQLNFTQLHCTTLSLGLTSFKFPTAPFHLPSLHFTSLHFMALLDDFRHTSIPLFHPVYNCFPNSFSKNLRFTRESP